VQEGGGSGIRGAAAAIAEDRVLLVFAPLSTMRREIVLLAVLVLILAGLLYFSSAFKKNSEGDARKFFLEDLSEKYPGADVREILNVSEVGTGGNGYLRLKARVTSGLYTPCPERLHVYYYYPQQNFIADVPEEITGRCVVCAETKTCVLAFPEEAIIASHKYEGAKKADEFIRAYPDAKPSFELLDEYGGVAGAWKITWDSPSSPYTITVYLSEYENRVIEVKTENK